MPHENKVLSSTERAQGFIDWVSTLPIIQKEAEEPRQESQSLKPLLRENVHDDAVFIGWQETPDREYFALFNITTTQHRLNHSTVTEKTLRKEHLQVPLVPLPPGPLKKFDYGT
jgi:hypothetical protein